MPTVLTITHLTGSLTGRSQRLVLQEGQRVRMGRAPEADIRFSDATDDSVSGTHAEISVQQNRIFIEDKRSTNGTFVNGQRCAPFQAIAVADGARVRLGKEGPEMQLLLAAAPAAAGGAGAHGAAPAGRPTAAETTAATATAATAASPGAAAAKESVGRATLLREIDRARQEERGVVSGQLADSRRSTGVWVTLGLTCVLVLAALGIAGAVYWNRRKLADEHTAASAAVARAEQEAARATSLAKENVWAGVERHAGPAVVHIRCIFAIHFPKVVHKMGTNTVDTNGEIVYHGNIQGSGVLVKPGLVLTARHLAEPWRAGKGWSELEKKGFRSEYEVLDVQFPGQQPLRASLVASSDKDNVDLALLQIQPTNAPYVTIAGSNDDVKVTDRIAVISYPADVGQKERTVNEEPGSGEPPTTVIDITPTFVVGTVTHGLNGSNENDEVTFDASVTNGSSGGAVLNERGELIGIVVWQHTREKIHMVYGRPLPLWEPVPGANVAVSPHGIQDFLRTHGMS